MEQATLKALQELDSADRFEYGEALLMEPALVETESPIIHFLRAEDFDPQRAAVRLAGYWKTRKLLFGVDRWLLPLNQTGNGALDDRDIECLRSGHIVLLPRNEPLGPVVLIDNSKLSFTAEFSSTRCIFYFAHVFAHAFSCHDGMTVIYVVSSAPRHSPSLQKEVYTFSLSLPLRFKQMLVAQSYEPGKDILIEFFADQQEWVVTSLLGPGVVLPRVASNSVHGTLKLLESNHGVSREFLPACLGGTYREEDFLSWIGARLSVELTTHASPTRMIQPKTSYSPLPIRYTTDSNVRTAQSQNANNGVENTNGTHDSALNAASITRTATSTVQTDTLHSKPPVYQEPEACQIETAAKSTPASYLLPEYIPQITSASSAMMQAIFPALMMHPEQEAMHQQRYSQAHSSTRPRKASKTAILRKPVLRQYQRQNITIRELHNLSQFLHQKNESIGAENRRLEGFLAQARYLVALHNEGNDK